ncbi:MAG: BTAD domain-containing putative transcriptional regulator [Gemmatimonadaceae bacterium]
MRIYLAGRVHLEAGGHQFGPAEFPGRQGRVAFAYLVTERGHPISREALASVLWPNERAPAWSGALHALISKLRGLLTRGGLDGSALLTAEAGCYELRLPRSAWVDLDAASDAIHQAESALRRGDLAGAYGPSAVAHHIARRSFLPGEEGEWIEMRRDRLRSILVRALECRGAVYLWNQEHALAVEAAREAVGLEPFRETAHQLLMRAHAAAGNTAEALLAYERCRRVIADELGVDPSPATKAVHEQILRSV